MAIEKAAAEANRTQPPLPSAPAASSTAMPLRRKLGRGLGSLLSAPVRVEVPLPRHEREPLSSASAPTPPLVPAAHERRPFATQPSARADATPSADELDQLGIRLIPIDAIKPNPRQPRQDFDDASLQALAESIRRSGLMQPIVVRPAPGAAPGFQLIAGERRWRAAQRAGLARIPAAVRDVDDRTAAEFSLVENLQREDLNPIERAEAFRRLIDDFGLTHAEVAERVGLERSSVTNHLRLTELDEFTRGAVRDGRLSMGHAKALLGITNKPAMGRLAARAVREDWSVRELERRAKDSLAIAAGEAAAGGVGGLEGEARLRSSATAPPHMLDLQRRLAEHLGTKVHLQPGKKKGAGRIVIEFYDLDQFEGIMRRMQFDLE